MTQVCENTQKYDYYSPRTVGWSSGGFKMSQKKWKFNVIDVIVVSSCGPPVSLSGDPAKIILQDAARNCKGGALVLRRLT